MLVVKNANPPSGGLLSSRWRLYDVIVGRKGGAEEIESGSNAVKEMLVEAPSPRTYENIKPSVYEYKRGRHTATMSL